MKIESYISTNVFFKIFHQKILLYQSDCDITSLTLEGKKYPLLIHMHDGIAW